jgi:dienelactone hydrolase
MKRRSLAEYALALACVAASTVSYAAAPVAETRATARVAKAVGAAGAAGAATDAAAARGVMATVQTTDGVTLRAHWFALPDTAAPRPAIIALHGCGGLYRADGKTLEARYPEYVARLQRAGYHVLLPDSFGSRGSGPICTQKDSERKIKVETRRNDVRAALAWLQQQPQVDAQRIALLGWSHGAMTALAAINSERPDAARPLAGAAVFYPGCTALLRARFALDTPLLMLLGANDDWTPPQPCVRLAERTTSAQPGADFTWTVYADSYHGFDSKHPVRLRADVPLNGGKGVHQGGNSRAREQAQQALDAFFARILQ